MAQKSIIIGLLIFSISFFTLTMCSNVVNDKPSEKEEVDLNWKIPTNGTIEYETVMEAISESTFEMELGGVFEKMQSSDSKEEIDNFFEKLKEIQSNTTFKTTLSNSSDFENVVDIAMSATQKEEASGDDSEADLMASLLKGTVLRGSINTDGSLHSFWVKNDQKNLLSLFFELPKEKVKKGDTWTLDNVNYIGNDQNFICREAVKENVVTLTDIIDRDGETIAKVDYKIREFVSGDFVRPSFSGQTGEPVKTTMDFQYNAQGEFSEDQGKWISFTALLSFESSGIMTTKQKQKISLVELNK